MRAMTVAGPLALLAGVLLLAEPAAAKKCKDDAAQVGGVCVDKYEASVWEIAPANTKVIKKVQKSKITAEADLTGATQRGASSDDYGAGCPDTANGCKDFYAVSIASVTPSAFVTWFQAAAACRNAGKRLATNQEWQMAALGTPDPGTDNGTTDCNVGSAGTALDTGARSGCVSDTGNFDMVGNLMEWVADWGDRATGCTNWDATYGTDTSCVGGSGSVNLPGALRRGGSLGGGSNAGVFAVYGTSIPFEASIFGGFRCARDL